MCIWLQVEKWVTTKSEHHVKDYKDNCKLRKQEIYSPGNISRGLVEFVHSSIMITFSLTVVHCTAQALAGRATAKLLLLLMEHTAHQDMWDSLIVSWFVHFYYFPYHNNNRKSYNFTSIPIQISRNSNLNVKNRKLFSWNINIYNKLRCSLTVLLDNMILHHVTCTTRNPIDHNNLNFFFSVVHRWWVCWRRVPDNKWRME